MIMQAGSGHIGSSFSSTDIITWLWTEELRDPNGGSDRRRHLLLVEGPRRAGAVLAAHRAREARLRSAARSCAASTACRAIPTSSTPFIATNTGSLGMGISKAYGMARAQPLHRPRRPHRRDDRRRRAAGRPDLGVAAAGRQRAARPRSPSIVDHNKLQSDSAVAAVSDLGPIEDKFRAFGWEVRRGDGHDFARAARRVRALRDRHRQAEGAHRRHDQGQGRVVHGRPRVRRPDLSLPRRRAVAEGLPRRRRAS